MAAAKVSVEYADDNAKFEIVGGGLYENAVDTTEINTLAKLPSLDELRGKIVGMVNTPATRIAGVVQASGSQLARIVQAKAIQSEAA